MNLKIRLFYLIGLSLFFSTQLIAGGRVIPETQLSVVYPSSFDANVCDQILFIGPIKLLALPNIPLINIFSSISQDPVIKNYSLNIEFIQPPTNYANLKIDGNETILNKIEYNMSLGIEVKLTEFEHCAESDKTLQLVELINFTPPLKKLAPSIDAKIEYIKENDQGACAMAVSKTLGDLVKIYNPAIDLRSIEANASIEAGTWSKDGQLIGKKLKITFNKKNNIHEELKSPVINIHLLKDLVYSATQRLSSPNGVLQMTKIQNCKGQKPDNPIWIYDLTVS